MISGLEMRLSRHVLKYLYIYYLPSGLFVVVSWVGFLIPPEVVPGRMAMLITLFLVLINIFNIVTTNSPNVEGMTAIGAWMLGRVCRFGFGVGSIRRNGWYQTDLHGSHIYVRSCDSVIAGIYILI